MWRAMRVPTKSKANHDAGWAGPSRGQVRERKKFVHTRREKDEGQRLLQRGEAIPCMLATLPFSPPSTQRHHHHRRHGNLPHAHDM